jgi:hypothetical protein
MAYIGKQPIVGNFVKLDAITTSATATYNLTNGGVAYFPQTANNCIVSLNGVIQSPTSAYTISGSTIIFSDALTASDSIDFILVLGDVLSIGTPSDGTVGFAKVTSNLITGATAETSIAGGDSVLIYDDSASALRKMTRTNFIGGGNTPAFFVYPTTSQTATHNTVSKITFGTESYDTDSAFASSRFTVPSGGAGKYYIYASVYTEAAANGTLETAQSYIYINGVSKFINANDFRTNQIRSFTTTISGSFDLTVGDYVEIYQYYYSSALANGTYGSGDTGGTYFGGFKLI